MSNKYKVFFSFELNNQRWTWDKVFHSPDIEKSIKEYLETKNLPLDLTNLKYKIKNE